MERVWWGRGALVAESSLSPWVTSSGVMADTSSAVA